MANPKVLVVGINPWVDNTGINTLINFFSDWGNESLAHIYTRDGLPNTKICNTFFRISENKLIKSAMGKKVTTGEKVQNTKTESNQSSLYAKKHSYFMFLAREMVWVLGKWKTKELNSFLDEFNPDVLFLPVYSTVYMNKLQNYIADYTKKPVILYASDDNYSYKSISRNILEIFHRFWVRKHEKKLLKRADKILVISPKQKEEYDKLFNTECSILTKGVDFGNSEYVVKPIHNPIKMVYTGKMIIGRWKSLSKIAEAMGKVNSGGEKISLDIYTTDSLDEKQKKLLNRNGCSVKGGLSFEEVKKVQDEADILVFAECLDKNYKFRARLSFSTKLTDYFKAGKCVLAIGDKEIAPIDYLLRNDAALVATKYDDIEHILTDVCQHPEKIAEYGKKAFECGKKNHSAINQKAILKESIMELL